MIDSRYEFEKMAAVESDLWWYRCLHDLVISTLRDHFVGRKTLQIIDAPCGSGGLMLRLKEAGYQNLRGYDLSRFAVEFTRSRGLHAELCDVRDLANSLQDQSTDVIIMNDVVMYIDLDQWPAILNSFHRKLRPGGVIVLNIAALDAFKGMHDDAVGIHWRLGRSDLGRLYDPSHYRTARATYWPFALSPVIYLERARQRRLKRRNPEVQPKSDIDPPPAWVNSLLFGLTSMENRLLSKKPLGSSLFLVLEKTAAQSQDLTNSAETASSKSSGLSDCRFAKMS